MCNCLGKCDVVHILVSDVLTYSSFTGHAWIMILCLVNGLARAAKREQYVVAVHRVR